MSNLLAARLQMAMSLGFHIIFAVIGIGLPLLMVLAEWRWLRTGDEVYRGLSKRWGKGAAILFAVGAVSGTVLSFELGLLWPGFMTFAGPVIGPIFGLEGFAFFTEAIFLGIYLYGWDRVSRRLHFISGIFVALSGALSGILVVTANSWMNTPSGFKIGSNGPTEIDTFSAMLNPSALSETIHMTLAAYAATGILVASVHAIMLRRDRENPFHRKALAIALAVGGVASILQPLSGDYAAKVVARTQPAKLAGMEGQFVTERHAPLRIGGIPDPKARVTRYAIDIPSGLSILAYGSPGAEVKGLNDFPPEDQPKVVIVHPAFQIMVACGTAMTGLAVWAGFATWRTRRVPDGRLFLLAASLCGPLGLIAVEAGWIVTEVGRQPWIIHRIMRTTEAVTTVQGISFSLVVYTALYAMLGTIVVSLLLSQFRDSPTGKPLQNNSVEGSTAT